MEALTYIWKDRKRILGMPISFTKYALTEDRIFVETGLLSLKADDVILYRVLDIGMRITLSQRIFGVGTVVLQSTDRGQPSMELKNIKQPREVKELLHKQVEAMKVARKLRVGEVLDDCTHDDSDPFI